MISLCSSAVSVQPFPAEASAKRNRDPALIVPVLGDRKCTSTVNETGSNLPSASTTVLYFCGSGKRWSMPYLPWQKAAMWLASAAGLNYGCFGIHRSTHAIPCTLLHTNHYSCSHFTVPLHTAILVRAIRSYSIFCEPRSAASLP